MIQIEAITITDIRGIRSLTLPLDRRSFVVTGPNGSGKSGVVDAIEFGLTGNISRLSGRGTGGVTAAKYGPHVIQRDNPKFAKVVLRLYLLDLKISVTLTRDMKNPRKVTVAPDSDAIREVLQAVEQHPEIVLARRQIIKFILDEAGQRAKGLQALLGLEGLGQLRSTLMTAQNEAAASARTSKTAWESAQKRFKEFLELDELSTPLIMNAINERRTILGLPDITILEPTTKFSEGVATPGDIPKVNKRAMLQDVDALLDDLPQLRKRHDEEASRIVEGLDTVEADSKLLDLMQRSSFLSKGLEYTDSLQCPLCDTAWPDVESLREHLSNKLLKSKDAEELSRDILKDAAVIGRGSKALRGLLKKVEALAEAEGKMKLVSDLQTYSADLEAFEISLKDLDGVILSKTRISNGWANLPTKLTSSVKEFRAHVEAKPDQTSTVEAGTFLGAAQERYDAMLLARIQADRNQVISGRAALLYETYCAVNEKSMDSLYRDIEQDFSSYYQELNADDEHDFRAEFTQDGPKLELAVQFYGRGLFPPGAYHSEGHQDGMGICLYLALMKRLAPNQFRFAVLDDVLMSIDRSHRKRFCRLLKTKFPDVQFVITTHDPIWARQMKTAGLVGPRATMEFRGWTVETGPICEAVDDIWVLVESDLSKGEHSSAAAKLRRHLEYALGELANNLGASVPYRGDADYTLGDFWGPVVKRYGDLLKDARKSADSWKVSTQQDEVKARSESWQAGLQSYGEESWVLNKAVHFNDWAQFTDVEVRDVVAAAKSVLDQLQCHSDTCGSWLYLSPQRGEKEALRCQCKSVDLNLIINKS